MKTRMTFEERKENLWHWYNVCINFEEYKRTHNSNRNKHNFCIENNISYNDFLNYYYRLVEIKNSENYSFMMDIVREYLQSSMNKRQYCIKYNIVESTLSAHINHANTMSLLKQVLEEKGIEDMNFVNITSPKRIQEKQLPPPKTIMQPESELEPELIKKQNDLELIIDKGIKVIVAPDITSDRLIKIIELLRDL